MHTRSRHWKKAVLAVFASAATWIVACQDDQDSARIPSAGPRALGGDGTPGGPGGGAIADGKVLFENNCAVCHGKEGKGDGTAAYLLLPRPRDFTRGKFKIRSTGSGTLPTDADLLAVITNGMPGTSMPSWRHLPEADRSALVNRVKELTQYQDADMDKPMNYFATRGAGTPVAIPVEPATTEKSIARGKELYSNMGCVKCHGATGRADGPSAAALRDDWDQPIRPNDFTQGIFRGGSSNRDIYLRFATGMNGTPMPAYGPELMSDDERWSLVHYVRSLSGEAPAALAAAVPAGSEIAVAKLAALPKGPGDAAWDAIPASEVALNLLFARPAAPRLLRLRAAHDGTSIALQLSWLDGADNHQPLRAEDFRDGVAIEWALKGIDTPIAMGAKGKPVDLWHWKADWQVDLGKWQDVEAIHPGMQVEWYPFQAKGDGTNDRGSNPAAMTDQDKAYETAWAAGNPMTDPGRKSAVEEAVAEGFGTLTSLPAARQSVEGTGTWKEGRWTVQMSRAMAAPDGCCVGFKPGTEAIAAFAVWDGAAGDRAGQKSVTMWFRLALK